MGFRRRATISLLLEHRGVCAGLGGAGGGRGAVSMIKKVEMEAAVRSWKALDTMFGTCT